MEGFKETNFTCNEFSTFQPLYAEHGIPTFPVRVDGKDKIPAIRGWRKVGLRGSAELAKKFESCDAFGFQPGARSKITILDVDTTNERVLADAQIRHGGSPLKVRTAPGKFHVYYRHNGEPRKNSAMARTADRSAWAQRVCGGSAIAGGERAISGYRGVT